MDDIIEELSWRGLIAVNTDLDELRLALKSGRVTVYCGFDPTAAGLHIGNLVQVLTLRRLQLAGHRPIGLVGGATGLIGDPSGKAAERVLNPTEVVAGWVERIRGETRPSMKRMFAVVALLAALGILIKLASKPVIRSGDPAETMSAPFCDRSMPSAWQSRAGPRARSRGAMAVVPRVRRTRASSSPAMTLPARSSTAEALPSTPRQTTFTQKCMP